MMQRLINNIYNDNDNNTKLTHIHTWAKSPAHTKTK